MAKQKPHWVPLSDDQLAAIKHLAQLRTPEASKLDRDHWMDLGAWNLAEKIERINQKASAKEDL